MVCSCWLVCLLVSCRVLALLLQLSCGGDAFRALDETFVLSAGAPCFIGQGALVTHKSHATYWRCFFFSRDEQNAPLAARSVPRRSWACPENGFTGAPQNVFDGSTRSTCYHRSVYLSAAPFVFISLPILITFHRFSESVHHRPSAVVGY